MGHKKAKEIALPASAPPDLPRRRIIAAMLGEALYFSPHLGSDPREEDPLHHCQREMDVPHFTFSKEVQVETPTTPRLHGNVNATISGGATIKKKKSVAHAKQMTKQPKTTKIPQSKHAASSSEPRRGQGTCVTIVGQGSRQPSKGGAKRRSTCAPRFVKTHRTIQPQAFSPRRIRAMTKDEGAFREVLNTLHRLEDARQWEEDLEEEGCQMGGEDQPAPEYFHSIYSMSGGGHNTLGPENAHEVYGDSMNTVDLFPNFGNSNSLLATGNNSYSNVIQIGGLAASECPQPKEGTRVGLVVKASSHWLHAHSFHTNETPIVVTGWVIAEYVEHQTGVPMLIVGFGGDENECHIPEEHVRFELTAEKAWPEAHVQYAPQGAKTSHEVAMRGQMGTVGIKETTFTPSLENETILRALSKRNGEDACSSQHNHNVSKVIQRPACSVSRGLVFGAPENPPVLHDMLHEDRSASPTPEATNSFGGELGDTVLLGREMPVVVDRGHDVPHDEESGPVFEETREMDVLGTQDSTAGTPFPKVSFTLPEYFSVHDTNSTSHGDSEESDWVCSLGESSEDDVVEDDPHACEEGFVDDPFLGNEAPNFHEWCVHPDSYKSSPLDGEEFEKFYVPENWCSQDVSLLGNRQNFSGLEPGATIVFTSVPTPISLWQLYWPQSILERIVFYTNLYALLPSYECLLGSKGTTRGGKSWVPLTVTELKAWFGIHIYMGLKPLPAIRNYWNSRIPVLHCAVIPKVMSCSRWEAILRCLHLVDTSLIQRTQKFRKEPKSKKGKGGKSKENLVAPECVDASVHRPCSEGIIDREGMESPTLGNT